MFGVLNVYLKNRFCGQLSWESERNRYIYRYAEEYLADPKAERLSLSLPLQSDAFDEDVSYRFFANLLPPEVVRRKLEKCLHVSRNNVFGFLKEIGRDCAGAVALCPPGIKPNPESDVRLQELDESRAVEILKGLKRRPLFAVGERGYRYSAAGAQDKLVVRYENGKLFLPLDGTPSTHIVKPGSDDFAESVANEYFCQKLAKRLGLRAAETTVAIIGGEDYYITRRFDREIEDGVVHRLHQEDFCQLLSVDPEMKYESDGGPKCKDLFDALRSLRAAVGETLALIDMLAFNFLIGNADAHAKNFSVVYRGKRPELAPLYDAVSTAVYHELSRDYAMSIGGDMNFDRVNAESFKRLADECEIAPKLVMSRLREMTERIVPEAEELARSLFGDVPSAVYAEIIKIIRDRTDKIFA